jgi:hypothetical protein
MEFHRTQDYGMIDDEFIEYELRSFKGREINISL